MSFDVNILVNGNRCKQYYHAGKTFVQANQGSEYVIELKNNHWKRVLAVGSVDGLNVLTGKTASNEDTGYIVGGHSSEKIKGFRISDTEWALFRFGYKFFGNTYAQSKHDGSEKNCGVIGLRFFYENEPIVVYNPPPVIFNNPPYWLTGPITGGTYTSYVATASYSVNPSYISNVNYSCNTLGQADVQDSLEYCAGPIGASGATKGMSSGPAPITANKFKKLSGIKTRSAAGGGTSAASVNYCSTNIPVASPGVDYYIQDQSSVLPNPDLFDTGTEFGRKEYSRVHNIPFTKGCLAQSFDIYYASREALIRMGVPLTNELSVNLPQSFPNEYCKPPVGWAG